MNKQILLISLAVLLTACGTSEVIKKTDSTYYVTSQYGSVNGSWDRALKESMDKATVYCDGKNEKMVIVSERRDGIYGFSPQRVDIEFRCESTSASNTNQTKSMDDRLREAKRLFDSKLITEIQYNEQVKNILNAK